MIRLCLSAANPAAANMVMGLVLELRPLALKCSVVILAQEPALSMFRGHPLFGSVTLIAIEEARHHSKDGAAARALSTRVAQLLAETSPDLLLTGLSGPDLGVDEWAIHHARAAGIPCLTLQDAPGWVVDGIDGCAETYLVESEIAAEMTRHTGKVRSIEVIGSLRKTHLKAMLAERLAQHGVRSLSVFFGQPLWQYDGYLRTLQALAGRVEQQGDGQLLYRPHPLETPEQISRVPSAFRISSTGLDYWQIITRCRIAYSCFSTALNDLALTGSLTATQPERLSYLLIEEDIRQAYIAGGGDLEVLPRLLPGSNVLNEPGQILVMEREYLLTQVSQDVDSKALARVIMDALPGHHENQGNPA